MWCPTVFQGIVTLKNINILRRSVGLNDTRLFPTPFPALKSAVYAVIVQGQLLWVLAVVIAARLVCAKEHMSKVIISPLLYLRTPLRHR